MADAAWYRAWRAAHPEYRERERRRRADAKLRDGRADRSIEYARARASRAIPPMPELHQGHPLFERARSVVGRRATALTTLVDPLYDDLVSVAVVALLERKDPLEAVRRFGALERAWGRRTAPLFTEVVA